jgi:hypothetical protein
MGRRVLAVLNKSKLRQVLRRMLDPEEFLSEYGIRSISKCYEEKPFVFEYEGGRSSVGYLPAESNTGMFSGNSNWRGPAALATESAYAAIQPPAHKPTST